MPRTIAGVLAGAGSFAAIMLALAGMAILLGWIRPEAAGRVSLEPWLVFETIGGAAASVLAGFVSRRVARRYRGPGILALVVLSVGLLEAAAILGYGAAAGADAPTWLVLVAPVVATVGVLLGGWRPAPWTDRPLAVRRRVRFDTVARYALPVAVLGSAAVLSRLGLPGKGDDPGADVVAAALALDFTVTAPALVYFLLVRAKRAPWIAVVPTFIVGYALAMATIPARHHAVLDLLRFVVVPAELTVIGYLVVLTRKGIKRAPRGVGDFVTRLRATARDVMVSRVPADILTTEIAILYYAFGWRRRRSRGPREFTVHREVAYPSILVGLLVLLAVETIALHALMSRWGPVASWSLTGLSLYAVIWLVGDFRAMTARPTLVTTTRLLFRVGVRWEADIPIGRIAAVEPLGPNPGKPGGDTLVAALLGQSNLRLRLAHPIEVIGMYGMRRTVRELWLRVDQSPALCEALLEATRPRGPAPE